MEKISHSQASEFEKTQTEMFTDFTNGVKEFSLGNLKQCRVTKRFSKKELTTRLGYKHINSYSNIEDGKVKLTLEVAIKLSVILETPLHELFFEKSENE